MADVKLNDTELRELYTSFDVVEREFDNFGKDLTKATANRVLQVFRNSTPQDTGETRRGWKISKKTKEGYTITNKHGAIYEFLVKGVQPHEIEPDRQSVLKIQLPGSLLFTMKVKHPGYSPQINQDKVTKEVERIILKSTDRLVTRKLKKNFT